MNCFNIFNILNFLKKKHDNVFFHEPLPIVANKQYLSEFMFICLQKSNTFSNTNSIYKCLKIVVDILSNDDEYIVYINSKNNNYTIITNFGKLFSVYQNNDFISDINNNINNNINNDVNDSTDDDDDIDDIVNYYYKDFNIEKMSKKTLNSILYLFNNKLTNN